MNVSFKTLAAAAVVAVAGGAAPAADGKTFLLTVAVSTSPKLPLYRTLEKVDDAAYRLYYALLGMVPKDRREAYHLTLAMDPSNHPTAEKVRQVLARFARAATPDDRVIVAFVGHGFENRDGAAVVLHDSDLGDPNSFLAVREIVGRVKAMRCREACVFVDACRNIRDDVKVAEATDYQKQAAADALNAKERKDQGIAKERSVVVVQSCAEDQYAFERPGGAGLMTESLTRALTEKGLADANGDGQVTIGEAIEYVRKTVRDEARSQHGKVQSVTAHTSGEPFVLAKVEKAEPTAQPGGASGAVAAAPPLPIYSTAGQAFGAPETRAAPARYDGTAAGGWRGNGASPQSIGNLAVGSGFDPNGPVGYGLGVARPFVPSQAQQYLPQPGVSLLEFGLGFLRR